MEETRIVGNLVVGKPDVTPDKPAHVRGVHEGNARGHLKREKGFRAYDQRAVANAARSTGINARKRNPIDPRMPNLSPS